METLHHLLSFYISITIAISKYVISALPRIKRFPSIVTLIDAILSLYFRFCGLSPCTVDLDDKTTVHFWASNHRRFDRPSLVVIHGYGGNSRWQFVRQVGLLSQKFNLYVPDLLFFGDSYSKREDRTVAFQAKCVCEGMKGLGVGRFSVCGISYGGYVAYRMAEIWPEMVEKVVIVSSGIGCTEEQKSEMLGNIGIAALDLLLPAEPDHLRLLVNMSIYKYDPFKLAPNFILKDFINVMCNDCRKEKQELLEHLLAKDADSDLPTLTQVVHHVTNRFCVWTKETLLIWGDKDNVFPLPLAYQLQRHLGGQPKLGIIKDTGHAANVDSPDALNEMIVSFVVGGSK